MIRAYSLDHTDDLNFIKDWLREKSNMYFKDN